MASITVRFYQLREGDKFEIDGVEYMKVWRSFTTTGAQYNAVLTSDTTTKRFVLDDQKLTPTDEYWATRISPISTNVHEL